MGKNKYWIAVGIEFTAILLWTIALFEINFIGKINPSEFLMHTAGIIFTCGSFYYAKFCKDIKS